MADRVGERTLVGTSFRTSAGNPSLTIGVNRAAQGSAACSQRRVRNLVAAPLAPSRLGSRFLLWSALVNPRNAEPL